MCKQLKYRYLGIINTNEIIYTTFIIAMMFNLFKSDELSGYAVIFNLQQSV